MFCKLRARLFPKSMPAPAPESEPDVSVEPSRVNDLNTNRPLPDPLLNTIILAAKQHLTDPDLTVDILSYTLLYWENTIDAVELQQAFDWLTMEQSVRWTVRIAQLRDEGIEYTTLQKTFLAVIDTTIALLGLSQSWEDGCHPPDSPTAWRILSLGGYEHRAGDIVPCAADYILAAAVVSANQGLQDTILQDMVAHQTTTDMRRWLYVKLRAAQGVGVPIE